MLGRRSYGALPEPPPQTLAVGGGLSTPSAARSLDKARHQKDEYPGGEDGPETFRYQPCRPDPSGLRNTRFPTISATTVTR